MPRIPERQIVFDTGGGHTHSGRDSANLMLEVIKNTPDNANGRNGNMKIYKSGESHRLYWKAGNEWVYAGEAGVILDEKVKYNADDASTGYLSDKTVAGTGISLAESSDKLQITNSAPDQIVVITGTGIAEVTGTYPNFNVDVPNPFLLDPVEDWWDITEGLPPDPEVGDRWISDGTDEELGWYDGYIYEWDGEEWYETVPVEGMMFWMLVELLFYVFFSGGWMEVGEDSFLKLDCSNDPLIVGAGTLDIEDATSTFTKLGTVTSAITGLSTLGQIFYDSATDTEIGGMGTATIPEVGKFPMIYLDSNAGIQAGFLILDSSTSPAEILASYVGENITLGCTSTSGFTPVAGGDLDRYDDALDNRSWSFGDNIALNPDGTSDCGLIINKTDSSNFASFDVAGAAINFNAETTIFDNDFIVRNANFKVIDSDENNILIFSASLTPSFALYKASDFIIYDTTPTEVFSIDGATGNTSISGTVTVNDNLITTGTDVNIMHLTATRTVANAAGSDNAILFDYLVNNVEVFDGYGIGGVARSIGASANITNDLGGVRGKAVVVNGSVKRLIGVHGQAMSYPTSDGVVTGGAFSVWAEGVFEGTATIPKYLALSSNFNTSVDVPIVHHHDIDNVSLTGAGSISNRQIGYHCPRLTEGVTNYEFWVEEDGGFWFRETGNYINSNAANYMDYWATTGHRFSIGGTGQINIIDGVFQPTTDNDINLGDSTHELKNLYVDGTAYIDGFDLNGTAVTTTGTQLNYLNAATGTTGTTSTNLVFSTSPTFITPILGTPTSGTLTSCTGLPISTGVSGLGANVATFLATPSSANLVAAVTNETGSGALAFATLPTFTTGIDVNGYVATRTVSYTASNGANNNINIGNAGFIKISGPTGAYSITGIAGGVDGRVLFVANATAQNLTFANESGSSTAANRIATSTSADVATAGIGFATLIYQGIDSRWLLLNLET